MSTTSVFTDFGQPRLMNAPRLEPFSEAVRAYALWRGIPRRYEPAVLIAQRDLNGIWRWCGGFAGLPVTLDEPVMILPLSGRVAAQEIRQCMWAQAISGVNVRNQDAPIWKTQIERHLPDDILHILFGPRGVTASSGAAHFGTTRQTLSLHLKDGHD